MLNVQFFYYLRTQNRRPAIMRKLLLSFFVFVFVNTNAQQHSSLLGSWSGKLDLGSASLTLVLHLTQTDDDVTVTLDERIADGFYFAKSLKILAYILAHPDILLEPISKELPEEIRNI